MKLKYKWSTMHSLINTLQYVLSVLCTEWRLLVMYKWEMVQKCLTYFFSNSVQKMNFSFKDFFSQCNFFSKFRQIWSHLLKKSLMENLCSEIFVNPPLNPPPALDALPFRILADMVSSIRLDMNEKYTRFKPFTTFLKLNFCSLIY